MMLLYPKLAKQATKTFPLEIPLGEFTHSKYTQRLLHNKKVLNAKNQSLQGLGELIEISKGREWKKNTKRRHEIDAKYGFYNYTSRLAIQNTEEFADMYICKLIIRNDANERKHLYDIQDIKKTGTMPLTSTREGQLWGDQMIPALKPAFTDSISETGENDNKNFSLKDSSGREISIEQAAFFKDSKDVLKL